MIDKALICNSLSRLGLYTGLSGLMLLSGMLAGEYIVESSFPKADSSSLSELTSEPEPIILNQETLPAGYRLEE